MDPREESKVWFRAILWAGLATLCVGLAIIGLYAIASWTCHDMRPLGC